MSGTSETLSQMGGLKFGKGGTWAELAVSAWEMRMWQPGGNLRVPEVCLVPGSISSPPPNARLAARTQPRFVEREAAGQCHGYMFGPQTSL